VRVVRCAVERIDDPALVTRAVMLAAFFREYRCVRRRRSQYRNNGGFTRTIGNGDDVGATSLLFNLERTMRVGK
jgi:hypothetical protein